MAKRPDDATSPGPVERVQAGDRSMGAAIGACWLLLGGLALLSWVEPAWFMRWVEPGRLSEAETVKDQGDVLLRSGQLGRAATAYLQSLGKQPDLHGARGNLGIVYLKQGRLEEARRVFEDQLRLNPGEEEVTTHYLGEIAERAGDLATAAAWYRRSAEQSPYPAQSWNRSAYLFLESGRLEEALAALEQAKEATLSFPGLLSGMLLSRVPKALDPDSSRLARMRSQGPTMADLEPYAAWVFTWTAARSRDLARAEYLGARTQALMGDTVTALAACERSLAAWPEQREALLWRAQVEKRRASLR
jgi:tetratricopeptide (TPR) repeat protein